MFDISTFAILLVDLTFLSLFLYCFVKYQLKRYTILLKIAKLQDKLRVLTRFFVVRYFIFTINVIFNPTVIILNSIFLYRRHRYRNHYRQRHHHIHNHIITTIITLLPQLDTPIATTPISSQIVMKYKHPFSLPQSPPSPSSLILIHTQTFPYHHQQQTFQENDD